MPPCPVAITPHQIDFLICFTFACGLLLGVLIGRGK